MALQPLEDEQFQIFVKIQLYTKNSISLQVHSNMTVLELSDIVELKTGVAAGFQKIFDPRTLEAYSPLTTIEMIGIKPHQSIRIQTNESWDDSRKRTRYLHVLKALKESLQLTFPPDILEEIARWDQYFFGVVNLPTQGEMNIWEFHSSKATGA